MEFTRFLKDLDAALADLPPEEAARIRDFYSELYYDAVENGQSEEEAVAALGDVGDIRDKTWPNWNRRGGVDRGAHAGLKAGKRRPLKEVQRQADPLLVLLPLPPPDRHSSGRRRSGALAGGLGPSRLPLGHRGRFGYRFSMGGLCRRSI